MRLDTFLDATDHTGETELRRAMTAALALEVPHDHDGYTRFYRRVIEQLDAGRRDPRHPLSARLTPAA